MEALERHQDQVHLGELMFDILAAVTQLNKVMVTSLFSGSQAAAAAAAVWQRWLVFARLYHPLAFERKTLNATVCQLCAI